MVDYSLMAGYARESKRYAASLETQVFALQELGITKVYTDIETGRSDDRDGFLEVVTALKIGQYPGLVVPKIDRFSRLLETNLRLANEFAALKIYFEALDYGRIDVESPQGWKNFVQQATDAEFYSRLLSANVLRTKQYYKANGFNLGGKVAFGYKRSPCKRHLLIDEEQHAIARRRIELFLKHREISKTVEALKKAGHLVAQSTLRNWLMNVYIRGHTGYERDPKKGTYGKIVYDTHPPIMTGAEWAIISRLLKDFGRSKYRRKGNKRHPLALHCFCSKCGNRLNVNKMGPEGHKHYYARHKTGKHHEPCDYSGYLRGEILLEAVNEAIAARANEIVAEMLSYDPQEDTPEIIEAQRNLVSARALAESINSREAKALVFSIQENIRRMRHEKAAGLIDKKRRSELILGLQDVESFDEMTWQELTILYQDLVEKVLLWDGEVQEVILCV